MLCLTVVGTEGDPHSVAAKGLKLIRALYDVERGIACDPADDRRKARKLSRLRAMDFFTWAEGVLSQVSARSPLAEALRYAVKLKPQLLAYTEDGRLEIDNNLAENALRGIAIGRNYAKRRIMRRSSRRTQILRWPRRPELHIITMSAESSSGSRRHGSDPAWRFLVAASSGLVPSSRDPLPHTCASSRYPRVRATVQ